MTQDERKLALYCLKASSDYHSEVCKECINYPKCDHMIQDDVTETIIKELEQEPNTEHWIETTINGQHKIKCSKCGYTENKYITHIRNYCPNCGIKMESEE